MAKYKYRCTELDGGIPAPYVDVIIRRAGGGEYEGQALIDSGSPHARFPWDVAEALGIERKECLVSFDMASGHSDKAVLATVEIEVEGITYQCNAAFCDRRITDQPLLLSRSGFFMHFRVSLDQRNQAFELTPYDAE